MTSQMGYYTISKKTYDKVLAERTIARRPGIVRKAFLAIKEGGEGLIARVPYGNEVARISCSGGRFVVKLEERSDRAETATGELLGSFTSRRLLATSPAGVAPANKTVQGQIIPCGVCVLVAGTGAGKTPTAHALASSGVDTYGLVRIGEPFTGYSSTAADASVALAEAMCVHENIVVDSIKDLLSAGGSLMKGGVSRTALLDLSTWSILAAHMGVTLYVPLNPSSSDAELMMALIEAARSNTTMTLALNDGKWVGMARTGEGMERDVLSFVFDRDADNPWDATDVNFPPDKAAGLHRTSAKVSLTDAAFSEVLHRATMDHNPSRVFSSTSVN